MMFIEFIILLLCILIGARKSGIALGTVAGIGLLIFVFGFNLPPRVVPGMIIAVITALATMLAASGLMMLLFKAKPAEAVKGSIMRGGIVAVISIPGISWLGSSFFEGNRVG